VHQHKGCVITQREVGVDTDSWDAALKNTLRQAPDVILIGEIRTRETMEHGIQFAETGHLVLATLHANSANQALDRIINFFPEERREQLLMDLSLNIRGLISQRLIPREGGKGRIAAMEIMLNSPLIQDLIFRGEVAKIKEVMARSNRMGMKTFDQALFELFEQGLISYEDALRKGRTVVVVMADDDEADAVRGALEHAGAESIDRAREMWWVGLRDAEKEKYETDGSKFENDERYFRCGFEAAVLHKNRDRSYEQCHRELGDRYPRMHESGPFKRGFERGKEYLKTISKHQN